MYTQSWSAYLSAWANFECLLCVMARKLYNNSRKGYIHCNKKIIVDLTEDQTVRLTRLYLLLAY